MDRNMLARPFRYPKLFFEMLYNDMLFLRNNWRITNGKVPWPRKSLFEVLWVHPDKIIGALNQVDRLPTKFRGCRVSGDWDLKWRPIEVFRRYRVFDLRYRKGVEWEDLFRDYSRPHGFLGENTINKYKVQASRCDELFMSMKEHGWKTDAKFGKTFTYSDGLAVNVTRDGKLIRNHSGLNRLIIARILGFEKVPCYLHAVHDDFRDVIDDGSSAAPPVNTKSNRVLSEC
jgi:hypothetical protein